MKKLLCTILAVCMLLSIVGCTKKETVSVDDLTSEYPPQGIATESDIYINAAPNVADLGLKIIQAQEGDDNVLISPMSVAYALAMTMNGANGNTLAQMEDVFGCTKEEINRFLYEYNKYLPENTEGAKLNMANSIWMRDEEGRLTVKDEFLQTISNYYGAGIYSAPFDSTTLDDINNWVRNNTDDMIDGILDKIPEKAVMYLINAIVFDAKWVTPYTDNDVVSNIFTSKSGDAQTADFMWSMENKYIATNNARGFVKDYKNGYSFVALLPNENITIDDYIASLTGETLYETLMCVENEGVRCGLPKFSNDYSVELSDTLMGMGMTDLFDFDLADLSNMGASTSGNLSVSRVLHKTHIDVDEEGTRAAATTAVEVTDECAVASDYEEVVLNRPFVYMLVDTSSMTPLFIGVTNNI